MSAMSALFFFLVLVSTTVLPIICGATLEKRHIILLNNPDTISEPGIPEFSPHPNTNGPSTVAQEAVIFTPGIPSAAAAPTADAVTSASLVRSTVSATLAIPNAPATPVTFVPSVITPAPPSGLADCGQCNLFYQVS